MREVEALRELGLEYRHIQRAPARGRRDAYQRCGHGRGRLGLTTSSTNRPGAYLAAHAAALFSRPGGYLWALGSWPSVTVRRGPRGLFLGLAHFTESVLCARQLRKRWMTHLHNHFANSGATVGLLREQDWGHFPGLHHVWHFRDGLSGRPDARAQDRGGRIRRLRLLVARAQGMRLVGQDHWEKIHVVRCGLPFDRLPLRDPTGEKDARTMICVRPPFPPEGSGRFASGFREAESKAS